MPNPRQIKRAREIIRENVRSPFVEDDSRLNMPKALLRRCGMKYDSQTLVVTVLHHRRTEQPSPHEKYLILTGQDAGQEGGLFWEICVSWSEQEQMDAEQAYEIAGLFLKPGEMEQVEFEFDDQRPLLHIFAPYIPELEELHVYEQLVKPLDIDLGALTRGYIKDSDSEPSSS